MSAVPDKVGHIRIIIYIIIINNNNNIIIFIFIFIAFLSHRLVRNG